ncbi:MAG TPA: hypothetical protein DEQ02_07395 [Ruminococcaceae bacterium]|nr:hypothetical protein [Oscillospiraceae bacterium]
MPRRIILILILPLCLGLLFTASVSTGIVAYFAVPESGVITGLLPRISAVADREEAEAKARAEAEGRTRADIILAAAVYKQRRPYYSTMQIGSARSLTGKCIFFNIFLSDGESSFEETEKQKVRELLRETEAYLEKEAEPYGKPLSIIYDEEDLFIDYSVDYVITSGSEGEIGNETFYDTHIFANILAEIDSKHKLVDIISKYQAENVGVIFNMNKNGRSFAMPLEHEDSTYFMPDPFFIYNFEICVTFTSWYDTEDNVFETTATTYAHEILHLFGAEDLYNLEEYKIKLAEEYFPNDIMLVVWDDIDICEIGELQAFLIGWKEDSEEKYKELLDPEGILE